MENNKLIAEFMGFQKTNVGWYDSEETMPSLSNTYDSNTFDEHELAFHTSWDWLMPVVEKIEHKIEPEVRVLIYEDEVEIWQKTEPKWTELVNVQANGDGKLSNTYKAVVEFINQYNK